MAKPRKQARAKPAGTASQARYDRFIAEYLAQGPKKNAAHAAIAAGYAQKGAAVTASRLLKIPYVADAIAARTEKVIKKLEVTSERITNELARIGFSDIRHAVRWKTQDVVTQRAVRGKSAAVVERRTAVQLLDSDEIDDDTAAAISEVSHTAHGVKLKFYDKRAALVDLGKITGLFKDGADITVPVSFVIERADGKKRESA